MNTVQMRLLGGHILAVLIALLGDVLGSTALATAGFAGAFLTLAALFVVMTGALLGGVAGQPVRMVASRRTGR